jgi:hypothetical protein
MKTRTKAMGSLFILGCVLIVVGVVLTVSNPADRDIRDIAEMLNEAPETEIPIPDFSLTEIPNTILPPIELPDAVSGGFQGYEIEIPEITIAAPETGSLTTEIPSLNFGPSDIQELINQATSSASANITAAP